MTRQLDKQAALKAIQRLREKAAAGDPKAKATLDKVLGVIRAQVAEQQMRETLLGLAAAGAMEEAATEEASIDDGGDEISLAEDIARWQPTSDQLAHKAALRAGKHQAMNAEAPFQRINPPSVLKGISGNVAQCQVQELNAAGTNTPNLAQIAYWPGDDAEAMPLTVTMGNVGIYSTGSFIEAPNTTAPIRPFLVLQYGTKGFSLRLEVDLHQGCQFTVGASQATLQVGLDLVGHGLFQNFPTVPLTGMFSFWASQKSTPMTRTRYIDDLAAGAVSSVIAVPAFAMDLVVVASQQLGAASSPPFSVLVVDSSGGRVASAVVAADTEMPPLRLPNDAAAVVITNNFGGLTAANFRAVFGLSV